MFKPKLIKCLVCKKKSFVFELGYCEEINGEWRTVRRDNGYCRNCGFKYKESDLSLEGQVKKYKIKYIRKLVLKVKNQGG